MPLLPYTQGMAELTVDEAVQRAMRTQDEKITAIRQLAVSRQHLADVRADAAQKVTELERENADRIGAAERDDLRLYGAATKAGWSDEELRKIGFETPAKVRRVARKKRAASTAVGHSDDQRPEHSNGSND